ncbi:hypothetical protein TWF718_010361 [Orbilia javanica]|uniref:Multiple myeloma tumor-associated protein 2-like N-terminal domain-containing protein n=1 Tax=Orbilia javanica TaxID=47235 RepID=A0AAN8RB05_9PEZI
MDLLKGPIREGSRGGRDFKWSDVKDSKDREYYLGVSVKAPTGRWQQNRDIQWYSRDQSSTSKAEEEALRREQRLEEIRKIKEAENDALSAALGFKVARRVDDGGGLSQGEVDRAIKEAGAGADEREEGNEKGVGFGRIGLAANLRGGNGGDREVMAGDDNARNDDGVKWRPAPAPVSSRESDKRDSRDDRRRRDDREKSSRHRHRSRSRDRNRGGDRGGDRDGDRDRTRHRRHRSRSRSRDRERKHESDRRRRDQSRSPRRHDDRGEKRHDRRDRDRDRDRDDRRRRND